VPIRKLPAEMTKVTKSVPAVSLGRRAVAERVVADLTRDLANGSWDEKHGALRTLDEHDVGLRLIVARP
jgi:hypothetical protein